MTDTQTHQADTLDDAGETFPVAVDAAVDDSGDTVADEAAGDPEEDATSVDAEDEADDGADVDDDSGDDGVDDDSSGRSRSSSRTTGLRRLEEEGEVAADYLEELLDIADIDGDIDIDVENGRASVAIVAEGPDRSLRRLVGQKGEVLEALQELSRLAVQAGTGERSRLMLDVAGHRAARKRALEDVAAKACQEVRSTGELVRMDPMTAFERKVVHDVVAEAGLVSESEGEDPHRRVVIKAVEQ